MEAVLQPQCAPNSPVVGASNKSNMANTRGKPLSHMFKRSPAAAATASAATATSASAATSASTPNKGGSENTARSYRTPRTPGTSSKRRLALCHSTPRLRTRPASARRAKRTPKAHTPRVARLGSARRLASGSATPNTTQRRRRSSIATARAARNKHLLEVLCCEATTRCKVCVYCGNTHTRAPFL